MRIRIVHWTAKLLGLTVRIEGLPFGLRLAEHLPQVLSSNRKRRLLIAHSRFWHGAPLARSTLGMAVIRGGSDQDSKSKNRLQTAGVDPLRNSKSRCSNRWSALCVIF